MSEPNHSDGSADEHTEQTEMVGRREAVALAWPGDWYPN
jgi:hypothetical protein